MDSQRLDILDCKVQVRTYVLVPKPSRWQRKGERTIVYPPVRDISTVPEIPAKLYHHSEEQNAVCLMRPSDFEKDGSIVYEKLRVSQSPSWVNAHGVALCESSSSNNFDYQRGDRIWIHIESNTNGFESSVPVINLRTYASGLIPVQHVCWYPHLRDIDEKIYTLGGDVRSLKISGPRNYSYFSWAICQRLDTSQCESKSIRVPTQDAKLDGCWLLTPQASQLLFEKKCQLMENDLRSPVENASAWVTPPPTSPAQRPSSAPRVKRTRYDRERRVPTVPTPPSTPPTPSAQFQDAERKTTPYDHGCGTESVSLTPPHAPLNLQEKRPDPQLRRRQRRRGGREMWRRIFKSVQTEPATPVAQSTSDTIPSEDSLATLNSSDKSDDSDSSDMESDDDTSSFSDGESLKSPGEHRQEADGLEAAGTWCGLGREEQSMVVTGQMNSYNALQEYPVDNVVPERYAKLCDLNKASCDYIFQFNCPHFHVPASKCIIAACPSNLPSPPHEHCIGRLYPYPGQAGPCMLYDKPSKKHTCCRWEAGDMVGWPPDIMMDYEQRRVEVNKRARFQVRDLSRRINRKDQFIPYVPMIFRLQSYDALEEALNSGAHDAEIEDMKNLRPSLDENEMTIDDFS